MYVDPVLSVVEQSELSSSSIQQLTSTFPSYYSKITSQCSAVLKVYKQLLSIQYKLNSWELATLRHSVNFNFQLHTDARKFDIKIAQKALQKCLELDAELDAIATHKISHFVKVIQSLSIEEYLSDPGTLLLKIYFKAIHLKTELVQDVSIAYTKAKLLIISYELTQIVDTMDREENPIVPDNTDFQSTLHSYKDFVSVLIDQLDRAVEQKDMDQIEECLGILNDVEKMYESVRVNFFINEEYNEWEQDTQNLLLSAAASTAGSDEYQDAKSQQRSRRTSLSSTTSSLNFSTLSSRVTNGTISEELPYLMQAFNEAKNLEQEISNYQPHVKSPLSRSASINHGVNQHVHAVPTATSPRLPFSSSFGGFGAHQNSASSHLQAGFTAPKVGFQSPLLNNLYGIHPTAKQASVKRMN